jgi:hypothetical protein
MGEGDSTQDNAEIAVGQQVEHRRRRLITAATMPAASSTADDGSVAGTITRNCVIRAPAFGASNAPVSGYFAQTPFYRPSLSAIQSVM